jgi:hypothetical protein
MRALDFPIYGKGSRAKNGYISVKHGHEMTEQEVVALGVPEILEAERKLAMISQDRQIRMDYERRRMAHHDAVSLRRDSLPEGQREGRQALADALVAVLKARGLSISPEQGARIEAEADLGRLKDWISRAALATSADAVLNG